mmetsp:Transcript_125028/g.324791  ORF Transcript_125028/g.324791 Transcript_125028/m.324791 type:complete len:987 (+) Transcript_125028:60-3020(+)
MSEHRDVFILALRQQVVFPAIRTSITIPPQTFSELCDFCEKHDSTQIGVVAMKSTNKGAEELYTTGTYCRIASHAHSTTKMGDKEVTVVTLSIEGQSRFEVQNFTQTSPFHVANIKVLQERETSGEASAEVAGLMQTLQQNIIDMLNESPQGAAGQTGFLKNLFGTNKRTRWPSSPSVLADMIAAGLSQLSIAERQQVLETLDVQKRLQLVLDLVQKVVEVQRLSKEINSKMQKRSEDELRETVLRRQLHELQREMRKLKSSGGSSKSHQATDGDGDSGGEDNEDNDVEEEEEDEEDEISALRDSLKKAQLSPDAAKIAQRELRRLQNIQPQHPEYTGSRTYLETLAALPWAESSAEDLDLAAAHDILENDHYGLDKVKRRILEFLAVQKMRGDMKGPILCLHGPPGVGKTSLGRSIAKALGRKFHRIALGGVRDEAELRGHRRTYIGSMPGNIMQALISMKVNNPVILLDEIDKLTRNAMFNPSGAMLELLDPEQNHTFKDHYINTPFDLSKVLFLCTCNDLNTIDRPLLDRMEVIDLSGYTVEEKLHIATTHLLPKQLKLHALQQPDLEQDGNPDAQGMSAEIADPSGLVTTQDKQGAPPPDQPRLIMSKAAITDLISKWTMESGVRSLERRVAQICRWAALRLAGAGTEVAKPDGDVGGGEADKLAEASLAECGPNAQGQLIVDAHHLPYIVGAEIFEPDLAERLSVGVAMGLGVTATGGQLLFVEATRSKGSGRLTVTGQLGEVMRESVSTAMSLLRSKIYYATLAATGEKSPVVSVGPSQVAVPGSTGMNSGAPMLMPDRPAQGTLPLGVEAQSLECGGRFQEVLQHLVAQADATKDPFGNDDIHVHFPAGAIPKDGPSAGVTTTLALASLLLKRPVRSDTAVTGEITLRGHILPVGGIRDKVLAAHRAGVRHVLLPFANQRHVKDDISASSLGDIELHFVKHIDEALAWAFADHVEQWAPSASSPGSPSTAPGFALQSKL